MNVDVMPPPLVARAPMSAAMGPAFARPGMTLKVLISPVLMDAFDADAASCSICRATMTVTLTRASARTTPVTMRTIRAAKPRR